MVEKEEDPLWLGLKDTKPGDESSQPLGSFKRLQRRVRMLL